MLKGIHYSLFLRLLSTTGQTAGALSVRPLHHVYDRPLHYMYDVVDDTSLACLGILSEIAWEVESLLVCIFRQI